MAQLLDVFGFLPVLLRRTALAPNTLVVGGIVFPFWVLRDSARYPEIEIAWHHCRRLLCWSGTTLALVRLCSFWRSFAVPEVLQHRLFVLLIVAYAVFEWGVRNSHISSLRASLVFPAVCAVGGSLLLTHTHSLNDVKEELLAKLSHIPLAVIAVPFVWSRRPELRLPRQHQRVPACI